ncbi:MAG: type II toxin-antitoxin system VapC family toxin [Longimicrobiales bacterium]
MRFWDSSAIVPLILEQPLSARSRELLDEDQDVVMWWGTPLECASAFARLRREGALSPSDEAALVGRLERLRLGWHEMVPGDQVRTQALRVLRLHPLRAADALQLAAALEWAGAPSGESFITFDERLGAAAALEGFVVSGR